MAECRADTLIRCVRAFRYRVRAIGDHCRAGALVPAWGNGRSPCAYHRAREGASHDEPQAALPASTASEEREETEAEEAVAPVSMLSPAGVGSLIETSLFSEEPHRLLSL